VESGGPGEGFLKSLGLDQELEGTKAGVYRKWVRMWVLHVVAVLGERSLKFMGRVEIRGVLYRKLLPSAWQVGEGAELEVGGGV
jgi:hypothetical protein